MASTSIPHTALFMAGLPTQNEFYKKLAPKTTKLPVSAHDTKKNTEKSSLKTHFPKEP